MKYILAIIGMAASFFIVKYREPLGRSIPDYDWMRYVGGIYGLIVIIAIVIFFWGLSTLTGTEDIFFAPVLWILPGMKASN